MRLAANATLGNFLKECAAAVRRAPGDGAVGVGVSELHATVHAEQQH